MTLYYRNVTDVTRDGCYDFFCFFHLSLKLFMYFSYALAWMDICWCQIRCYSENGSGILIDLFLWHYLRDGCYGNEILMCSWWQSSDNVRKSTICINKLFLYQTGWCLANLRQALEHWNHLYIMSIGKIYITWRMLR